MAQYSVGSPVDSGIGWQAGAPPSGPPAAGAPPAGPPPVQFSGKETPSAPPMDSVGDLPGYEGTTFDGAVETPDWDTLLRLCAGFEPPPPPYEPPADAGQGGQVDFQQNVLTDAEVRSCLSQHVSENCCYGKGPLNNMKIVNIVPSSAFKYTLDTFTEKRVTKWKYEPSDGHAVPTSGLQPPGPWEVPVSPPKLFDDHVTVVEVPNTETVKSCHDCQGHGDVRCGDCGGRGYESCDSCSGTGTRVGDEACTWCNGTGSKKCTWCNGNGMKTCKTCEGKRFLRCYVELTVTWKKHDDTFVVEKTAMPDKLVKSASGQVAYRDEHPRVTPVSGFLDPQIGQAAQDLVQKHATKWPQERIIMQRQKVQVVPVNTVEYVLDGKEGAFYIYGDENKVHFPDYPSQCCGCCCVM